MSSYHSAYNEKYLSELQKNKKLSLINLQQKKEIAMLSHVLDVL